MKLRISFFSFFVTQKREDVRVMAGGGGPEWSYEARGMDPPQQSGVVCLPFAPFPPRLPGCADGRAFITTFEATEGVGAQAAQ